MRTVVLATAIGLSVIGLSTAADSQAAICRTDIPAQALRPALQRLSEDRDLQLVFRTDVVGEMRTGGAVGELTIDQALTQLLSGTGLTYQYLDDNTVTIIGVPASNDPSTSAAPIAVPSSSSSVGETNRTPRKGLFDRFRLAQADQGTSSTGAQSASRVEHGERIELEEIVVTGSRLQRAASESPSPVIAFSREDIERTGVTSLQQLVNYLSQASTNNDASGTTVFAGSTAVRLRGLPAGTALVLINGRRTVLSGAQFSANFFNLNNIPLSAVERVEVLTDSASAVYGADALAGVVNVILRKGVTGAEFGYRYGSASDGDTDSNQVNFTTGFDSPTFKVTAFVEGFEQSPLLGSQIDRIANADYRRFGGPDRRDGITAPGNVYAVSGNLPGLPTSFAGIPSGQPGTGLTQASFLPTAGALNLSSSFSGLGENRFAYDIERYSGLARVDYEPGSAVRFFGEVLFNDSREVSTRANTLSRFSPAALVPATNPFNPFGTAVQVNLLLPELPTGSVFDWKFLRLLLGAGGSMGSWEWELGLLGTRDETRERDFNQLDLTPGTGRVARALADPNPATALNPFAGGAIPASQLTGLLRNDVLIDFESQADQADLQFRGPLGQLPAGPILWAVGGEARKEKVLLNSPTGDRIAFDEDRDVRSGFVEMQLPILGESAQVPLMHQVTLTGAVRYDRYSDFGSATSPQFGLTWALSPRALVRVSRGESFRPPSLRQLFASQPFTFGITDPRRGNQGYSTPGSSGGNPDLDPESGDSMNVGLVLNPLGNDTLVASADFWRIELTERILQVSATQALANESLFPELVTRAPASVADRALGFAGPVTFLRSVFANFGQAKVEGVDVRVTARSPLFGGTLSNTLSATYVSKYDAAILPGQPLTNRAGVAVADGYAPRIKASWIGSWTRGGWDVSPGIRFVDSYQDYADPSGTRTVESSTLFDLGAGYSWPDSAGSILGGAKLSINVINVFNEEPPYSNSVFGYDTLQSDILKRQLYINLRKRF